MAKDIIESNFLEDLYGSARELVTDRFSSPFIFSFLVSWLIFNYRAVIIIFTNVSEKLSIDFKLSLIHQNLISSSFNIPSLENTILLNAFIWPFLAACFYTFIYPFADYYITRFTLDRKVNIRNARTAAEGKIIYSQKDVHKIYQQHLRVEKDLATRLERSETTENQLRAVVNDLEANIKLFVDVQKQKEDLEIKFRNINDQYQKDLKNKQVTNVEAIITKESATPNRNKKTLKDKEDEEINNIINGLSKRKLEAIIKIGTLQNGKDIGIDDVNTNLEGFYLESLETDEIFTKGTNPKSLNKTYKLSYKGKKIYELIKNNTPKL